MVEKILLAIDESAASSRAISMVASMGLRFHAEVVVMEVPSRGSAAHHVHVLSSETLGGAAPLVDRVVMDLKDCGVSARPELWLAPEEDMAIAMAHLVRHEAVDLIVMGNRAADLRLNGSTPDTLAERVRSLTRTPILLVP